MGLWDAIKHQLIEVIEWTEPSDDILAYRFPVHDNEIKNGAQLTVRESQVALLVDQGKPADQFTPGLHRLTTANLPILTKLKSWPYGFNSPFKSEVYFYSLRQKLGQKWGTPQPVTIRDREFGSVQIRMFGIFSYHISDAPTFYRQVSGTREVYTTDDLAAQLVPTIVGGAATAFGQSNVPFLDMAANQVLLSETLRKAINEPIAKLGVTLDSFVVESVTLPDELQKALNARQSMGILGNMQQYAQYQTASSIPDAAKNPSGLAGLGAGIAAGVGFGGMMGQAMQGMAGGAAPATQQVACVACGKGIDAGSTFCRWCGRPQKVECPKCHAEAAPGSGFCAKCGTKLTP